MPRLAIHVELEQGLYVASASEPRALKLFGFGLTEEEAISDFVALAARYFILGDTLSTAPARSHSALP